MRVIVRGDWHYWRVTGIYVGVASVNKEEMGQEIETQSKTGE